jgi:methionyl-tRNA formyltransferase
MSKNDQRMLSLNAPRVVLLTYPSLFAGGVLNAFGECTGIDLVGVGLSTRVYKGKGRLATARTIVDRTGSLFSIYSFLATDVSWWILRAMNRPAELRRTKQRQVRTFNDVNSAETCAWIESLAPDYIASCYFNQLIRPDVYKIPKVACVNMHPALLPALRGPDPCYRAMEQQLETSGFTIHLVDESFDTGGILHQEEYRLPETDSLLSLSVDMWSKGADVFARWLADAPHENNSIPQSESGAEHFAWPTPQEVRAFKNKGLRLMRVNEMFQEIARVR